MYLNRLKEPAVIMREPAVLWAVIWFNFLLIFLFFFGGRTVIIYQKWFVSENPGYES
jgi:hypothetical protein